jgi:hypothetical protein
MDSCTGTDPFWRDPVPGVACGIDNGTVIGMEAMSKKSFSQIEPDPFHRVQFRYRSLDVI